MSQRPNTLETVFARLDTSGGETACHPWTGWRDRDGYGWVTMGNRGHRVHRLVAAHFIGPVEGLVVRHTCDNPPCGNPAHLLIGTHADNRRDMRERGRERQARGEAAGNVKLTEADVLEIRRLVRESAPRKEIAARFGISLPAVCRIGSGKSWAWLHG